MNLEETSLVLAWDYIKATFEKAFYAIVLIGLFVIGMMQRDLNSVDLRILYESGQAAFEGVNPYRHFPLYLPAWSLLLFSLLSLLPFNLVHAVWTLCTLAAWVLMLHKLEVPVIDSALFLLNPFFIFGISLGNFDWLVLLGLFIPAKYGIWLLFLKPQIILGVLFLWVKQRGVKYTIETCATPILIMLACFALGLYRTPDLTEMTWNQSLGIWGVPIGLSMIYLAFKKRDNIMALGASPFFSPYVGIQSWSIPFLLLVRNRALLVIGLIASWIFIFVR